MDMQRRDRILLLGLLFGSIPVFLITGNVALTLIVGLSSAIFYYRLLTVNYEKQNIGDVK